MLDRRELAEPTESVEQLRRALEALERELASARARSIRWRAVIERHLDKGCPSRSLRALLLEFDRVDDDPGLA